VLRPTLYISMNRTRNMNRISRRESRIFNEVRIELLAVRTCSVMLCKIINNKEFCVILNEAFCFISASVAFASKSALSPKRTIFLLWAQQYFFHLYQILQNHLFIEANSDVMVTIPEPMPLDILSTST